MKYFPKEKNEPKEFALWKEQDYEKGEINRLEVQEKSDKLWSFFPSTSPLEENKEAGINYYSKSDLLQVLLKEQGYLCCYCNRIFSKDAVEKSVEFLEKMREEHSEKNSKESEIADAPVNIEHVIPKSRDVTKTLSYHNLMASCNGCYPYANRVKQKPSSCNLFRSDKPIYVFPNEESCEAAFYFDIDGKIRFKDDKKLENAIDEFTIQVVRGMVEFKRPLELYDTINNLGLSVHNEDRGHTISGFLYENKEAYLTISKKDALYLIQKLSTMDSDGRYQAYCTAIIYVLLSEILLPIRPIINICQNYPIIRAWLFGSYATGTATEDSDIDILVEIDYDQLIGLEFVGMWLDLQKITGKKVDLITTQGMSPILKPYIEKQKKLIYERG
jgi:uncharacterized protein (TIGR02646 family)